MAREVDKLPKPTKVRPMTVIGLGPSRTGTLGLYSALQMLGYKPFHITELLPHGLQEMRVLQEAITANSEGGKGQQQPFGRPEFDRMWADYDCIIESPCYLCPGVVAAYLPDPDVKFVLTVRSPASFAASLAGSLGDYHARLTRAPALVLARLLSGCALVGDGGFVAALHGLFGAMTARWAGPVHPTDPRFRAVVEARYEEYISQVKALVPPDRLLVLSLEDGFGWDELCGFLGRPAPDAPYPRLNAMSDFHVAAEMVVGPSIRKSRRVFAGGLGAVGLFVGWWAWRSRFAAS